MATFMVTCTFREGTDMTEVFATIEEEQAQAAALVAEGRVGSIYLALARGTVFIETFAEDPQEAIATIKTLPMAAWWDLDVFAVTAPPEAADAAGDTAGDTAGGAS